MKQLNFIKMQILFVFINNIKLNTEFLNKILSKVIYLFHKIIIILN